MECWTASPDLDPGERVLPSAAGTDPTPFLIPPDPAGTVSPQNGPAVNGSLSHEIYSQIIVSPIQPSQQGGD